MEYPVLYTFRRCPYAIRARMALAYSNIKVELREVVLRDRPNELYSISAKGTVPVLHLDDMTILEESLDIMFWSLKCSDSDMWLYDNIDDQIQLIEENDVYFKKWLDRYKYFDKYPNNTKEYYRSKCESFLCKIEHMLAEKEHLFKNSISMADVAIFPFIRQFAHVDRLWLDSALINVSRWLDGMVRLELFTTVMKKYDKYYKGQDPLITNFNYKDKLNNP